MPFTTAEEAQAKFRSAVALMKAKGSDEKNAGTNGASPLEAFRSLLSNTENPKHFQKKDTVTYLVAASKRLITAEKFDDARILLQLLSVDSGLSDDDAQTMSIVAFKNEIDIKVGIDTALKKIGNSGPENFPKALTELAALLGNAFEYKLDKIRKLKAEIEGKQANVILFDEALIKGNLKIVIDLFNNSYIKEHAKKSAFTILFKQVVDNKKATRDHIAIIKFLKQNGIKSLKNDANQINDILDYQNLMAETTSSADSKSDKSGNDDFVKVEMIYFESGCCCIAAGLLVFGIKANPEATSTTPDDDFESVNTLNHQSFEMIGAPLRESIAIKVKELLSKVSNLSLAIDEGAFAAGENAAPDFKAAAALPLGTAAVVGSTATGPSPITSRAPSAAAHANGARVAVAPTAPVPTAAPAAVAAPLPKATPQ